MSISPKNQKPFQLPPLIRNLELCQFYPPRFTSICPLIRELGELSQFFAEMDTGPVNFLNFPVDSQWQFLRGWPKSGTEHRILLLLSFNNFFKKSNIFGDSGEKILSGHDNFLGEGVILRHK